VHDCSKPKKTVLSQINTKISGLKNRPGSRGPGFECPTQYTLKKLRAKTTPIKIKNEAILN
jgi:hypothetical protein